MTKLFWDGDLGTEYSGIIVVNKPLKMTSHDVVAQIRRIIRDTNPEISSRSIKVGHSGTLDPLATGVLLVCISFATRLIEYTHVWPKTYQATITLGATSTTDDQAGVIKTINDKQPDETTVKTALSTFRGEQMQKPPAYAAIKVKGRKMYELARQGRGVDVPDRPITIHDISLDDYEYPNINVTITCSTGTYIRALARDLGQILSTGAYLSQLQRTTIGPFRIANATLLKDITATTLSQQLQPANRLIEHLPQITISAKQAQLFQMGQIIPITDTLTPDQPIAVYTKQVELIGIGTLNQAQQLVPEKVVPEL